MVPRTTIAPHSNTILNDLFKAYRQSLRLTIICRTILYGTPHATGLISCIWVTRYYYLTNIAYLSSTGIIFWVHQYANSKLYFYKYPLKMLNLCLQKILSYRSSRFGYFSQHPFWVFFPCFVRVTRRLETLSWRNSFFQYFIDFSKAIKMFSKLVTYLFRLGLFS